MAAPITPLPFPLDKADPTVVVVVISTVSSSGTTSADPGQGFIRIERDI